MSGMCGKIAARVSCVMCCQGFLTSRAEQGRLHGFRFCFVSPQKYTVFLLMFLTRGEESEVMLLGGIRLPV